MRYEVVVVFRYRGLGEHYYYKHSKKFVIDDISNLSSVVESLSIYYTIVSIHTELLEEEDHERYWF